MGSILIDDKEALNALKNTDKAGQSVGGSLKKMGGMALKAGAVVGTAAIAGGAALYGMAKKAATTTDRIDKMSQKIGISREGFQEWDYILSQNGMEIEKLQGGMKALVNTVDEAIDGTGKGAESFKKLGISVTDSSGKVKSQEDIFNETVIALQGMEEGTEKAKLANDLFGRSGSEMMPLLNGAAGSVEELRAQAHELGIVMGDEAIDAGVMLTDTMDSAKRAFSGVATEIGVAVMPMVQQFMEWIIENMPQIKEVFSTVFGVIKTVVETVIDVFKTYFMPVIQAIIDHVKDNLPQIQEKFETVFGAIKQVWEDILKPVFEMIVSVMKVVWDIFKIAWPHIQTLISVAFEMIKTYYNNILKPVFEFIVELVKVLVEEFKKHMPAIEKLFKAVAETIKWAYDNIIKPKIEAIGAIIKWLMEKFNEYLLPLVKKVIGWFGEMTAGMSTKIEWVRGVIDTAIKKIVGFFDGFKTAKDNALRVFDELKNGLKEKIEWARDKVKEAIDKIRGFFNFTFKWPELKMPKFKIEGSMNPLKWLEQGVPKLKVNWNAEGGIFNKPTIFNTPYGMQGVGEAGPEAIMPLSKLQTMLDMNTTKIDYKKMGEEVANALKAISQDSNIYVDGRTFGRLVKDYV